MPLNAPKKRKLLPLTYREFRLQWEGAHKKTPVEETISPNRSEDYQDISELSEEMNAWNKVNIGPDKQLFHEPLQHFPGVYPTASLLSLHAIRKAHNALSNKNKSLVYFKPKRAEPNFDNVDVYDTDNRKIDVKHGPVEKAREFDYDGSLPGVERGMETEYEVPTPYLGDAWIGPNAIFGPYL